MTRALLLVLALPACGPVTVAFPAKDGPAGDPDIDVDVTALDFGARTAGEPATLVVTVSNTGEATLTAAFTVPFGDEVFTTDASSATLAPGDSTELVVTFLADEAAAYSGTLDITSDDPDEPLVRVPLAAEASLDADRDGHAADVDCDDGDATVYPGADDTWYDGVDSDCAGDDDYDQDGDGHATPEGGGRDCDDLDPAVSPDAQEQWYDGVDADCDGRSDGDQDGDGYDAAAAGGTDCDDTDATVSPGTLENPDNGVDDDCDGETDEGLSTVDADGDSWSEVSGDCNDADAAVNPGATEAYYDGLDQDCDGASDWDADADGAESSTYGGTDCDDADGAIGPGATETWYDGIDQDCDGNDGDQDGDGVDAEGVGGTDCDDTDATVYPGAPETWYDGIDQDCDGANDGDADGDGHVSAEHGGDDCDDTDATVSPSATETWYDGVDQDCDGNDTDQDGDGVDGVDGGGTDCDDTDAAVLPGAAEVCNGADDDCDGTVDDGVTTTYYADADSDGHGAAASTTAACSAPAGWVSVADDCDDADATAYPGAAETCDGADDDCDGTVDDGVTTTFYADADGDGYGSATAATAACAAPSGYVSDATDCDDGDATTHPGAAETCDDADDDCDGTADEGLATATYYADADSDGYGDAAVPVTDCAAPSGYVTNDDDCDDGAATSNPAAAEAAYDLADNDCDGTQDEMDAETESDWTVIGTNGSDAVGAGGVLATEDLDADGYGELVIGVPSFGYSLFGTSYGDVGGVVVHDVATRADPSDLEDGYLFELGLGTSDYVGNDFVLIGDQDGGGYSEIAIGAYGADYDDTDDGGVYIVDFSAYVAEYVDYSSEGFIEGTSSSGYLGYALASGDVDGDGLRELLVSAPGRTSGKGRVLLFDAADGYAGDTLEDGDANWSTVGANNTDHLGYSVAMGDFDGGGGADLAMCAPDDDDGGSGSGVCFIVFGESLPSSGSSVSGIYDAKLTGASAGDALGQTRESIAVGDLDGDGVDDLAVGAPGYDGYTASGGGVFAVSGPNLSGALAAGTVDWLVRGDGALGTGLSLDGDVDGDGVDDLLAGATTAGSSAGVVYLFSGDQATGTYTLPADQTASWTGKTSGDAFGTAIGGLYDLDADGLLDFAVSATGNDDGASGGGKVYVVPAYP